MNGKNGMKGGPARCRGRGLSPWCRMMVLALAPAVLPAVVWCGWALAGSQKPYEVVTPPTLKPGDPLPPPDGRVVLVVRGGGRAPLLKFDRPTLERLGLIRYTSKNIWYDKPVTYEGVLGAALLAFVGVPEGAEHMKMRALNDYVVKIPIAEFHRWPVMLALKLNGAYMSVRERGPIWVVYPNHLVPELISRSYQGRWIWQLQEITFE